MPLDARMIIIILTTKKTRFKEVSRLLEVREVGSGNLKPSLAAKLSLITIVRHCLNVTCLF